MVAPAPQKPVVPVLDYGQDVGAGYENQDRSDISIPFLVLVQDKSRALQENPEAKPGMLYNSVTGDVAQEVLFVPVTTKHVYVEWIPRKQGGGFVGQRPLNDPEAMAAVAASKEFGHYVLPNGNELQETYYLYALILNEQDGLSPSGFAAISITGTKIAVYRRMNTQLSMFTVKAPDGRKVRPPLFAHTLKIGGRLSPDPRGDYWNITLAPAKGSVAASLLPPGHEALEAAKELRDMINTGLAKVDYAAAKEDAASAIDPDWNS